MLAHRLILPIHPVFWAAGMCFCCFAGVSRAFQVDLAAKVAWAEDNPQSVADIVKEANNFASHYLSKHGQQCFAMQILDRYSRMISDVWQLRHSKHHTKNVSLAR